MIPRAFQMPDQIVASVSRSAARLEDRDRGRIPMQAGHHARPRSRTREPRVFHARLRQDAVLGVGSARFSWSVAERNARHRRGLGRRVSACAEREDEERKE